ncbi:MAG: DUF2336 domain-containing protein [Ferruginibacter sp.]
MADLLIERGESASFMPSRKISARRFPIAASASLWCDPARTASLRCMWERVATPASPAENSRNRVGGRAARSSRRSPQMADAVRGAVTDVIDDINHVVRNGSQDHARARKRVRRRTEWKDLSETDVHGAARAEHFERTVMALSALAGCPIEIVERAVLNENPGAVQIVARVAGCSWATTKALLLMTAGQEARNIARMDLERARENFERLELATAKRVLEFYELRRNAGADAGQMAEPMEPESRTAAVG